MVCKLWNDNHGGVITTELLLVSSVVAAGVLSGLGGFKTSLENEFVELGAKVSEMASPDTAHRVQQNEMTPAAPLQIYLPDEFESLLD